MKIFSLSLFFMLAACVSGNCRSHQAPVTDEKALAAATAAPAGTQTHIKVYKYDGSLQCAMGKAIAIGEMQKGLGDIQVFSSENKADGLMHIQACGTPTGKVNIYEIEKTHLDVAKKNGFREWTGE